MTTAYPDHPQLTGNYAPIRMEADIDDLVIQGELPDLDITFYRNGPDPQFPPRGDHHWFGGDGMLHMFRIQDSRVSYRNRWVRTDKWQLERREHRSLFNAFNPMDNDPVTEGPAKDGLANTNVVWHGDKLLALEEAHAPYEIDPDTLESVGPWRFDEALEGPMTAHPKIDPQTGEMVFFGYMADGLFSPTIRWHTVDESGALTKSDRFEAPYPSMVHDFIVSEEHVIVPIFPLTGDLQRAMQGRPAFAWEPDKGTHLAVLRRDGTSDSLRWFETDPCFVFHPMNAYEDGNRIIAHVMEFEKAPLFTYPDGTPTDVFDAYLTEWVFDLADNSNGISRRRISDVKGEFPRLDERFACGSYRHGYFAASHSQDTNIDFNAIAHHDFETDETELYRLPEGDVTGEPVFIPRAKDAEEGDGVLMSIVYRSHENRSDLIFLDATNVASGPVACAELPHRVPFGFHGNWRCNS